MGVGCWGDADIECLVWIRFGLAVDAVVGACGAEGRDDVFFFEI